MTEPTWVLRVRSGKQRHTHAVIPPGGSLRVGHGPPADLAISTDRHLGLVHFTLHNEGSECRLTDAGTPDGTLVNGLRPAATPTPVSHGTWLRAGETDFSLYKEAHTPPLDDPRDTPQKQQALAALRATTDPLFGVFDSARDMRVLELLRESAETVTSLYDGDAGEAMADAAPYLVSFPRSRHSSSHNPSSLLTHLIHEGWGQSWGIYLTSPLPFTQVRRHLRRFLIVQDDDTEERLYFRFYDPRVLRVFLPTCTPRQRADLFGEITRFFLEDGAPEASNAALLTFDKLEKGAPRGRP